MIPVGLDSTNYLELENRSALRIRTAIVMSSIIGVIETSGSDKGVGVFHPVSCSMV